MAKNQDSIIISRAIQKSSNLKFIRMKSMQLQEFHVTRRKSSICNGVRRITLGLLTDKIERRVKSTKRMSRSYYIILQVMVR